MKLDLSEFAKPCACGREHAISVKEIILEAGALRRIPALLEQYGYRQPVVLCDENTLEAAGRAVRGLLPESGLIVLNPENLHANEHGVAMAEEGLAVCPAPDVLLAVGSGTVHDITRYIAHKRGLPFVSVPTAASVDGFVSTVAAMTWHGCKKTFPAVAPSLVVADTDVFSRAPQRLNASGFSQVSSWEKITSINKLKRGDLIFFKSDSSDRVSHVGIYLGSNTMIDASASEGEVVKRSLGSWSRRNFVCGRRPIS